MTVRLNPAPLFVTQESPCPYVPGRVERKVFAALSGPRAFEMHNALAWKGFRRSQNVAYRPNCIGCHACVSVRVRAAEFKPNTTDRRLMRRNADIVAQVCEPWATEEQFNLLRHYLTTRHPDGGMVQMDEQDYADMLEQSPVETEMIEYRMPTYDGSKGRLLGACITDHHVDGLSMQYSFYDPFASERLSMGRYMILDHIARTAAAGLPYVYLGFYVPDAPRMAYKAHYQPMEYYTPSGWRLMHKA